MRQLFASLRNRRPVRRPLGLAALAALFLVPMAAADTPIERVKGFFCDEKGDSIDFLVQQSKGENEEMAANAVNKKIAKFSCAYYIPATAVHTGNHTVIADGMVFKLRSYIFLPEKVERWSGTVFGSMTEPTTLGKLDI